jgi:uncharacterized protein YkwD
VGAILGAALLWQGSDDQEQAMLTLINDYRAANGRLPLVEQAQLMAAAEVHSLDQAAVDSGFSTHIGSDQSSDLDRVVRAGYTNWAAEAENVYYNSADGSAAAAFNWWQGSPGHNANMLSSDLTEIGIARASGSSGGWYWTTVFGRQW